MNLIAGSSHPLFAQRLAKNLGVQVIPTQLNTSCNNELRIQLQESCGEKPAVIVQTLGPHANDQLMELLLLADTARKAGAPTIIAVIPYLAYSRQDRAVRPAESVGAQLLAKLLEAATIDHVITLEVHTPNIADYCTTSKLHTVATAQLFVPVLAQWQQSPQAVVVAPDRGSMQRAQTLAQALQLPLASMTKTRDANHGPAVTALQGAVAGKHCIIIDDIIDTGQTLYKAIGLLKQHHVASVEVCATHAVLAPEALVLLQEAGVQRFTFSDSIPMQTKTPNVNLVSAIDLVAKALQIL